MTYTTDHRGRLRADSMTEYEDARERGYNPGLPVGHDPSPPANGATAEECAAYFGAARRKKRTRR